MIELRSKQIAGILTVVFFLALLILKIHHITTRKTVINVDVEVKSYSLK